MATANRMIEVLQEQQAVLQELQQALRDEQQAIIALDTARMEAMNSLKEQLVVRQRTMAESLRQVLATTAQQLGLSSSATLSEIATKMPASLRPQLEALQQSARKSGAAVALLAEQNRVMLERFLGVVNDSLAYILRILNTSNTYGVRGTYLSNTQAGAVMVSREA